MVELTFQVCTEELDCKAAQRSPVNQHLGHKDYFSLL